MIDGKRCNCSKENYDTVRKFATYPNNQTFDTSLTELIAFLKNNLKRKEMKKQ